MEKHEWLNIEEIDEEHNRLCAEYEQIRLKIEELSQKIISLYGGGNGKT